MGGSAPDLFHHFRNGVEVIDPLMSSGSRDHDLVGARAGAETANWLLSPSGPEQSYRRVPPATDAGVNAIWKMTLLEGEGRSVRRRWSMVWPIVAVGI